MLNTGFAEVDLLVIEYLNGLVAGSVGLNPDGIEVAGDGFLEVETPGSERLLERTFRDGFVVRHKHAFSSTNRGRTVLTRFLLSPNAYASDNLQRLCPKFVSYNRKRGFELLALVWFQRRAVVAMHATAAKALPKVAGKRRIKHRIRDKDMIDSKHGSNVARGLRVVN